MLKSRRSRSPRRATSPRASPRSSPRSSPRRAKTARVQPASISKFLSTIFNSREQAHILHLQTKSYATHKALDNYYNSIVPLVDKYIETYQGKYGIVKGYKPASKFLEGEKSIPYFKQLEKTIVDMRSQLPKDLDLENAYADILDLIHTTNYLINQLH